MHKAIVLLSGGLNSATAAAQVKQDHELYAVFVNFHQRPALKEQRAYEVLCEHLEVKHHWKVEMTHFRQIGGNCFVGPKRGGNRSEDATSEPTSRFVATLIPTLLNTAAAFAARIGAGSIVVGISEAIGEPAPGSAALYPDNRREFLTNYQYMLDSAFPPRQRIAVSAPLIDFDRSEIVKLGQRLQVPFAETWSCYEAEQSPCGMCFGCSSRAAGFMKAGVADPQAISC